MIYTFSFSNRKATPGEFTPVEVAVLKSRTSKFSLGGKIMSTTRSTIVIILLAVFGLGLSGCADVSDVWSQDLVKAGFTDPVPIKGMGEASNTIIASAGNCRIRFVIDRQTDAIYAEVPGSDISDEPSFVRSPSLEVLRQDERFSSCFGED